MSVVIYPVCKGQVHISNDKSDSTNTVFLADPAIFVYDNMYYLYGTSGHDPDQGFEVYTSTDMQSWESPEGATNGYALRKEDVFGGKGFWAPQVFHYEGKFYMAYTANEHIAIAVADSPIGPFKQKEKKALSAPVKQIDPFVFMDDKGALYYVFHTHYSDNQVSPRRTAIVQAGFEKSTNQEEILGIEKKSFRFLQKKHNRGY